MITNPTLLALMRQGCKVDFTPDQTIGGHWPKVNILQGFPKEERMKLQYMVGNHIEETYFPLTLKGLIDALRVLQPSISGK